jgi:predicted metal-dependent TIM-barrel fold hydrolase
MIEMYGPERLMANSAGDWGPSKPTAIPDLIFELRRRGHPRSLIEKIVYDNPRKFFAQSRGWSDPPLR